MDLVEKRYEWIDGAKMLLPSPTTGHQGLATTLTGTFFNYFKGNTCSAFVAPLDVELAESENGKNIVQPDLLVVSDKSKITDKRIVGAPDLVVEIVSFSNSTRVKHDVDVKYRLYEKNGVREYWIVLGQSISVYHLVNGQYELFGEFKRFDAEEDEEDTHLLTSAIFPDLTVDLNELFE